MLVYSASVCTMVHCLEQQQVMSKCWRTVMTLGTKGNLYFAKMALFEVLSTVLAYCRDTSTYKRA